MELILSSQSAARKSMLEGAGYHFKAIPADIDEAALLLQMRDEQTVPEAIAMTLAAEKALHVSRLYPEALVIGSDQILVCENKILSKAPDVLAAREKLLSLAGKTHNLLSGVSVAQDGKTLWSEVDSARLTMRDFDESFLDRYCDRAGPALINCVGAYELESLGVHLFDSIEGDYYTILGMPLLKLVKYLRLQHGIGL